MTNLELLEKLPWPV